MRVIGTAGHVDHGKSALIWALTGINPDRLREEQERQMTIDLGFAWMTLPDGEEIGFIDVPGHRDFIDNMLAGIGAIDAALFVVAVDEGVMPQTREHLAILDLLQVEHAIVVLTKMDLIDDRQWLDLVIEDLENLLIGTSLSKATIVPVSGRTGEGLENLKNQIATLIKNLKPRPDFRKPRLSIDRAFTISGFGTVVTGTLIDGTLSVGQEVEVLPKKLKARIRGLQTHKTKVDTVIPGSRTAVNLTGIDVKDLARGDVVTLPGQFSSTNLIDVHYRHLSGVGAPLKHDQEVKVFIGAAQQMARVRVLGAESIKPGQEGWLQLVLEEPIVAARQDHYILRRPSPGVTLGGGYVADPHPRGRHRRRDQEVLNRLEQVLLGTPGEILAQSLILYGPMKMNTAIERAGLSEKDAVIAIEELKTRGEITTFGNDKLNLGTDLYVAHKVVKERISSEILSTLEQFHSANPLKFGMSREEIKSRSKLDGPVFSLLLRELGEAEEIDEIGSKVAISNFKPILNENQQRDIELLLQKFDQAPYSTPSVKESISFLGEDLYAYLAESEEVIQVSSDVVYRKSSYELMLQKIRDRLQKDNTLSVAEVRDLFNTSRKYALALMEHLDSIGMTVRQGDVRRLLR
ncbi:MAG: selenocysteine-specific translation elongation factor [Chloroflexi bacterium RBG_16_48_8]|nr:MAG: selenocysteine-specific translation elongation factor [Chloroflexi bacterium RBG_16_48_8]